MFNYKPPKNKNKGGGHFVSQPQSLHEKVNQEGRAEIRPTRPTTFDEFDMDSFKHQLAKISAILAWIVSVYFSYEGFKFQNESVLWVGYLLAFLVTCGEFIFNTEIKSLSLTLVLIGLVCYVYGVYSNVVGFWSIQYPDQLFVWNSSQSVMSWFVGAILEIYPEAAFAWGMRAKTGDLVGNVVKLAGGAVTGQKREYHVDSEIAKRIGR